MNTSRMTIVFHPNESRIDIILNDAKFNNEKYSFSRELEACGEEFVMLQALDNIIGIQKAEASKNVLNLEISGGMLDREFMPQVIEAVRKFGSAFHGEDYAPRIIVDNRRYEISPEYNNDGITTTVAKGVKQAPNAINIGVPYTTLQDFQLEQS